MPRSILPVVISLLALYACSDDPAETAKPESPANNLTEEEVMTIIHCAEMPMPECEAYEGITLTEEQIKRGCEIMPEMAICEAD